MAELRRAIHSGWPKPARLGGHNALRGSRCRRPGPAPPPAVRRDRRRADGDARRAEGGALIRSSDSRVLLAEAVDCQNRTLSPSHQAVVRVRAQPQRTDASVRVHQRMLRACQMSVVSQDSNLAPCSSAAGLRAPAPRETAQSRPARPPRRVARGASEGSLAPPASGSSRWCACGFCAPAEKGSFWVHCWVKVRRG